LKLNIKISSSNVWDFFMFLGNLFLAKKPKTTALSAISFLRKIKKDAASIPIACGKL
jgi:hypothetical protein